MSTEDLIGLMIPMMWLAMLAWEAIAPARPWPVIRWWRTKSFAFFVMLMGLNAVLPSLLPPGLTEHHLVDGRRLGVVGGVLLGLPAFTLATALLHRLYHHVDLLWRWVHQLHHAPQRLDVAGAVVFTPQEVVFNVALFQLVVVFILGLDPLAAAILGALTAFYGLFQHFNIRTPTWLGWFIQRPEAHGVHHRRGFHAYNYSDFPPWDMLMGTWRNPREFHGQVGFEGEPTARITPMLVGRDANARLYGPASRGSRDVAANPA
ncbi:sterol desaturase family protein [Ideonella sp.]|uniref:sterol desaturase family protein n=1 Tax=Ideonella sp. TaxID=1929293 RepID=UPI002B46B1EB|nr:sterol desaturase family protein [Ideonella sp.]HJV68005.1 sterol desaturase family protein [Ideonella sp.]